MSDGPIYRARHSQGILLNRTYFYSYWVIVKGLGENFALGFYYKYIIRVIDSIVPVSILGIFFDAETNFI